MGRVSHLCQSLENKWLLKPCKHKLGQLLGKGQLFNLDFKSYLLWITYDRHCGPWWIVFPAERAGAQRTRSSLECLLAFLPGTQCGVLGLSQCLWNAGRKRKQLQEEGKDEGTAQSPEKARRCARVLAAVPKLQRPSRESDAPPVLFLTSVHLRHVSWLVGLCCCSGDPLEKADSKAGGTRKVTESRTYSAWRSKAQRCFPVFENISAPGTSEWDSQRVLTTFADVQCKTQAQKITGKEVESGDNAPSAWTHSQGTQALTSVFSGAWEDGENFLRDTKILSDRPKGNLNGGVFYPWILRWY